MDSRENTERLGIYKCGEIFEKMGFIFREQKDCDYGIDAIIERKDEKYPSINSCSDKIGRFIFQRNEGR